MCPSRIGCPDYSEADNRKPNVRRIPITMGRAKPSGDVISGTATNDSATAIARCARAAIAEMVAVAVVPAVLSPLPDIAVHLVEAPGIWLESVNRNCALAILSL
jgi:hypothetical protein